MENTDPSEFFAIFDKLISDLKASGEIVSEESKLNYFLLALASSMHSILETTDAIPAHNKNVTYLKLKIKSVSELRNGTNVDS